MTMNRDEFRALVQQAVSQLSDEELFDELRRVSTQMHVMSNGRIPWFDVQRLFDTLEGVCHEAMDRFSLDDDVIPDRPHDLVADDLAGATWCALHTEWSSHADDVREWLFARARTLMFSLEVSAAAGG